MANTNGTTNATVIAQEALVQLQALLPVVKQVASDFSSEGAKFGETIIVHEVAAVEAIDFNADNGYAPTDRVQVDIPVVLNKHKHHTYRVGVNEASSSRVDLIKRYGLNAAYAVAAALVNDLCGLVKASNFSGKTVVALGSGGDGFDRKGLNKVGLALDERHVAPFGRFALLNAAYYASLMDDSDLMTILLQGGADAIKTGVLPDLHGFAVSKYTSLPENGENLVGFAGTRTGLAIATRIPDDPGEGSSNCSITTATDAQSGLSMQVREWYNPDLAQFRRTYTLMYGVAKGQTGCIQRILSKDAA